MAYSVVVCGVAAFVVVLPPYFVNGWRRRRKSAEQLAAMAALEPAYRRKFVPVHRLGVGYVVVVLLLVFFTVQSPMVSYTKVSRGSWVALGVITIALVLCFFLMLLPLPWLGAMEGSADEEPVRANEAEDEDGCGKGVDPATNTIVPNMPEKERAALPDGVTNASDGDVDVPRDFRYGGTVWDNLKRLDIWLIFMCQSVMGVIVVYNASAISVALTGPKRSQQTSALYTAFLGVSSSVGRMSMGMFKAFVQRQLPNNRRYMVTLALPLSPLLAAIAGVLLLTLPGEAILFPYIIVYFEEGVLAAVGAVMFPSLFANDHAVYYNVGFLTALFSVVGCNSFLFSYVVDANHASLGFGPKEECSVAECVHLPLIVATCVAAVGAPLSFVVHIHCSRFVRKVRREMKEMN
ncbi:hypothetical protein TraAM80_09589 [Trypanosoma rangeli]|uniref:Nodulin-like domain-containing protein n=1 Tax=Trypanosoma rangeli TaxID=5698 RepID=A0A3R7R6N6_TRYRA|nr:uncharacterized protein TraAM80_09589 [Trypanosoma rangeli]RNE96893.1 hypothetical protein TraAM80_09589 [Trypanosoma rangeli]|eukprot:RNE96893.1 hypothetical protein TraAM80_09589 [Trypanosoma rangeli]